MFENEKLLAWLEECLTGICEHDGESPLDAACMIARYQDGFVATGYYNADAQDKAIFAHNINADAMLDVVCNNAGVLRRALDELDEEDESCQD